MRQDATEMILVQDGAGQWRLIQIHPDCDAIRFSVPCGYWIDPEDDTISLPAFGAVERRRTSERTTLGHPIFR